MKQFVNPTESYRRDFQLLRTYVSDQASHLHLMTGRPLEECTQFVKDSIKPGGKRALDIPDVNVLVRNEFGDRERKIVPFDKLLQEVFAKGEILSPSLTAYTPPSVKVSLLAQYIDGNLAKRQKAKHEKFDAERAKNDILAAIKESAQTSLKLKNNSLSGAQCSQYTPLWNKSAHSTLTSTCRTATSYGNANNEKFLMGNRHYWSPDIVTNNIISIINHSDYEAIERVMTKYNLQAPSAEQVEAAIFRSTRPYWRSESHQEQISALVYKLSALQRSAFLFTSDLYHLAQVNPQFVRQFFTELAIKPTQPLPVEEAEVSVKQADDDLVAFVSMLCSKELQGKKIKDIRDNPQDYGIVGATVQQIIRTVERYEDFIRTFWVTDNLPSSVYYLPSIIRQTAITSDTDSTIFTVQYWTEWYVGKLDFSQESLGIGAAAVYLTGQLIRHILARCSANMGVVGKDVTRLAMKNEFYFTVFCLTTRAKHYFAWKMAQEGNVYHEKKIEIKGVGLRNSNVPAKLTAASHALMKNLMDTVEAGEKISLMQVLRYIAKKEKAIHDSVFNGNYEYLKISRINTRDSYKSTAKTTNHDYFLMWEEVFATKYGHAPEPPYRAIKIPLPIKSNASKAEWLGGIQDRAVADKMSKWITTSGRKSITQMLLPEPVLLAKGIPDELKDVLDIRNVITQVMEGFYIVLECLGYYRRNDYNTRLVMDEAWLLDDDWPYGELNLP